MAVLTDDARPVFVPIDPSTPLAPVELSIVRACHFKAKALECRDCKAPRARKDAKKPCPSCGSKRSPIQRQGCAREGCGLSKHDRAHYGAPPSLNVLGSGDPMHFQAIKQRWTAILAAKLDASGLPRGLARVVVEGEATFPDRARRDQGNYRVALEKALGDTLVNGDPEAGVPGGWLEDDDWTRYEFGGLAYRYEAGVSRTRLELFPSAAPKADDADALALPV